MGRPPATEPTRRTVSVRVRLTPREHARLRKRARDLHRSLAGYVRLVALRGKIPPPPVPAVNLAAVGELNRIGNNLNQAVHLLHTGYLSSELASALSEIESLLRSLRRQLIGLPEDEGS